MAGYDCEGEMRERGRESSEEGGTFEREQEERGYEEDAKLRKK